METRRQPSKCCRESKCRKYLSSTYLLKDETVYSEGTGVDLSVWKRVLGMEGWSVGCKVSVQKSICDKIEDYRRVPAPRNQVQEKGE